MELWGVGFNGWGQLQFDSPGGTPDDVRRFTRIWRDESIQVLALYLTATIVRLPTGVKVAGRDTEITRWATSLGQDKDIIWPVAIAGNGLTAARRAGDIKQYDNPVDRDSAPDISTAQLFDGFDASITALVANYSAFTALTACGTVYTWGDERLPARLGRPISDDSPANKPCIIEDLSTIPDPVIMIRSGGTLTAALTFNHDIYTWGSGIRPGPLTPLWHPVPFPLDLGTHEFLDIAIGSQHAILLTTEHRIFVLGNNRNCQLGVEEKLQCSDWTEVSLPIVRSKQRVTKVYAGHNNSLFIVEDIPR